MFNISTGFGGLKPSLVNFPWKSVVLHPLVIYILTKPELVTS